jgi:hypothetical protein
VLFVVGVGGQNVRKATIKCAARCGTTASPHRGRNHVNENPEQDTWTTSRKVYANCYVDDTAVGCPLVQPLDARAYVDWSIVGPLVMQRIEERA